MKNIRKIACTRYTLLGIDTNGNVRAVGDNQSGTFGNGRAFGTSFGMSKVSNAVDINASGDSVIVTTVDGAVWTWGGDSTMGEPKRVTASSNHNFNRADSTYRFAEVTPFEIDVVVDYGAGVNVTSTVQPADVGKVGSVYVVAQLGSVTYFNSGSGWVIGDLASPIYPAFFMGQLSPTTRVKLPYWSASLSGATVYVGYGSGTDPADMLKRINYRVVYTYQ